MSEQYTDNQRISRTYQTSPAAISGDESAKFLESAFGKDGFEAPDWLSPDLEDGTAPNMRAEGLDNTVRTTNEQGEQFAGEIWPRVVWDHTDEQIQEQGKRQIETLVRDTDGSLDGFVIPKVGRPEEISILDDTIQNYENEYGYDGRPLEVGVIVESAAARSNLKEIASHGSPRLHALIFGPGDYTFDVGGQMKDGGLPTWPGVMEAITNEASKNDLVSIGGPFPQIYKQRAGVRYYNGAGYAEQATFESEIGFDGSWSLHPNQTVQANRIHMPTKEKLEEMLVKFEEFVAKESSGAITVDGDMIDEAMTRYYSTELSNVIAIDENHPKQSEEVYSSDQLERARELLAAN